MTGFLIVTIIFSLLIGITASIFFYLIKKYLLKKNANFGNNIWIGAIVAIICFLLCTFFINGMDHF